jgi:hypothetical protein
VTIPSGEEMKDESEQTGKTLDKVKSEYTNKVTDAENAARNANEAVKDTDIKGNLGELIDEAKNLKIKRIQQSFDTAEGLIENDNLENISQNTILPLFFIGSPTLIAICSLLKLFSDKTFRYFAFIL